MIKIKALSFGIDYHSLLGNYISIPQSLENKVTLKSRPILPRCFMGLDLTSEYFSIPRTKNCVRLHCILCTCHNRCWLYKSPLPTPSYRLVVSYFAAYLSRLRTSPVLKMISRILCYEGFKDYENSGANRIA